MTNSALYEVLKLRPAGDMRGDGTDYVRESLDDAQFLRDLVKTLLGELHAGEFDDAELGRKVRERIFAYCESCPAHDEALQREAEDKAARYRRAGAI